MSRMLLFFRDCDCGTSGRLDSETTIDLGVLCRMDINNVTLTADFKLRVLYMERVVRLRGKDLFHLSRLFSAVSG